MALVSRPVEVPVPCPSPARVGSTGTIHYLLQKERPRMDHPQSYYSRSSTPTTRQAREFVQVCREVVSVSCGQPLLSYKPKRSKSALSSSSKAGKTTESKQSSTKTTPESSTRSVSTRVVANAIRLAEANEGLPIVDLRSDSFSRRSLQSTRAKIVEVSDSSKGLSQCGGSEPPLMVERRSAPGSICPEHAHEENVQHGIHPVYQASNGSRSGSGRPIPDEYHKALIPFLRAESEASAKILKRRPSCNASKKGMHRRSTSLGSSSVCGRVTASDEKAWQSYSRDSYPPFSTSKRHSYFRLPSGKRSCNYTMVVVNPETRVKWIMPGFADFVSALE
ncbi:hypothetical protein R1sor_006966 [Riccia sorocarpa]|uniref:Uncharacterized protein n=1 Tax=Riccia sorocarpa TaxID=122646 RepID=A0ABD3HP31_9MARC